MNVPSAATGNWSWRVEQRQLTREIAAKLLAIADLTDRTVEAELAIAKAKQEEVEAALESAKSK